MRKECAKVNFVYPCFYEFFMQNCLGLFTREFLLNFEACFNIAYLGYIICENAFFYFEFGNILTTVNINRDQQQLNFFVTSFMSKV